MFKKAKLASCVLLLGLTGCAKTAHYPMGKGDGIAQKALSYVGSTDWAYDQTKRPHDRRFEVYKAGCWKCNVFVADVLHDVGITPPGTDDQEKNVYATSGRWAIRAKHWKNSDVPNFKKVSFMQKGDIVSDGVHCGIAINSTHTVAAGKTVVYEGEDLCDGVIKRYEG
jgi:hypothetical protein